MFWGIHALQGYQAQIVEACMEYADDKWLCYDRRFCQNAAANPGESGLRSTLLSGAKLSLPKLGWSAVNTASA